MIKNIYQNLKKKYNSYKKEQNELILKKHFDNIKKTSIDTTKFTDKKYSSTYGELTLNGYNELRNHFPNTKSKNNFMDLGSGNGKVPIMVSFEDNFHLSDGVELSTERYNIAKNLKNKVMKNSNKIHYYNKDLFDINLQKYNVIYTSNLCFNDQTNLKIAEKLSKELNDGSYIFSSKPLNHKKLKFQKQIKVEMTWNKNHLLHMYIVSSG